MLMDVINGIRSSWIRSRFLWPLVLDCMCDKLLRADNFGLDSGDRLRDNQINDYRKALELP